MDYLISKEDRELLRDIIMQSDLDDEDKLIAEEIFEDIKKHSVKLFAEGEIEFENAYNGLLLKNGNYSIWHRYVIADCQKQDKGFNTKLYAEVSI